MRIKLLKAAIQFSTATALFSVLAYWFAPMPEMRSYMPYSSAYFDKNGQLLRLTLAEDDRYRIYMPLANMSPTVAQATILYEDQDYYAHSGVDLKALIRATWDTYIARSRRIGASTITMQVARLRWDIASHQLSGKIHQILRAIQLSRHYSKDEILEQYLNLAPYGRNIEGVAAASLIYFDKRPSELSLPEALTLAVIPQNPSRRNPTSAKSREGLLDARKRLFTRWVEHHPQDQIQISHLDLPLIVRTPEQLPYNAPHFVQLVANNRSRWDSGYVDTTLNGLTQRKAERVVEAYVERKSGAGIKNAAALLVNYKTMAVEAMVGSADFFDDTIQGQVSAITAKRSPGSTLKPFVYGLAIDEGLIHPLSLLKDSPRQYGGFTPENYDKQFWGPISVKDALIESRNVPAVALQSQLRQKSFYDFLQDANVEGLKEEGHYGLALALGGGELSMLELASLYATLANQGIYHPIQLTEKLDNKSSKRILTKEASYMVLDMLSENTRPGQLALEATWDSGNQNNQVAWKTGTSWAFRDAWAVGVSGDYVLVVWVGNFDGSGNDAFVGRSAAGPLMFSLFDAVNPKQGWRVDNTLMDANLNLKQIQVCAETGDLYEKHCRASADTWFIPGVSPIKVSNIYRAIPINMETGLRACFYRLGETEMQVYEFWPSDFLHIFNQAGIMLKTPPSYEASCDLDEKSANGLSPAITLPQSSVQYVVNMKSKEDRLIPLKAIVDPDVSSLHWFIDNTYIGSANRGETMLWEGQPGNYILRAVDDSGRSTLRDFVVTQVH